MTLIVFSLTTVMREKLIRMLISDLTRVPMQDAGWSLSAVARWTSLLPPVSLLSCILWSLIYNYDKATYTHCEVPELLPSISSVIGGFELQRFLWTFSVAITTGPRIVFCKLKQINLCEKYSSYKRTIKWNFYLNVTEILCLLTLSLVPSSEIFLLHATAFSVFILTSLLSMTVVTYYIKDTRNRGMKKNIVTISWVCVCLAFYFYNRHNEYCEPYIYTGFAMCEYLVVGSNMVWHSLNVYQFSGYRMEATPYMELK